MTRGLLKQAALSEKLNQTHVLWPVELAWERVVFTGTTWRSCGNMKTGKGSNTSF